MSTRSRGASMSYDSGVPWVGRATSRWGHWGAPLLIASIGAAIALCLHPLEAGTPQSVYVPVALLALVIASWLMMRKHDRHLCEHCMAAMPLNAMEQATRYQRRFAVAHAASSRPLLVIYMVILIGSNALVVVGGTPGRIVWAAIQSSMVYLLVSYTSHRRLQPWCPWCSDGGGGEEQEDAPEPLPNDSWQTV